MVEVIQRSGLLIPRKYEKEDFYLKVKEELIRTSKAYQTSNLEIQVFYVESDKFLLVPRYFPLNKFTPSINVKDYTGENLEREILKRSIKHISKK